MKLLTILLNYKTADMTVDAAKTALRELEPVGDYHLAIVDNDSQDGSFEALSRAKEENGWGERVSVHQTGHNGGFGFGNNYAIRLGLSWDDKPDYFYILNSDAFPEQGAIKTLVDYLDGHPTVGIVGSYLHGPDGEPHTSAFRFFSLASEIEGTVRLGVVTKLLKDVRVPIGIPDGNVEVDWLAGASMMIRRAVLEDVGLFDETFFLYFEETDLCLRAKRAGWSTVYVRDSSVTHIGSASTQYNRNDRPMPTYWFDSRRHYFRKNHGRGYLFAANVVHAAGFGAFRVRQRLLRQEDNDPPRFWRDFVTYNFLSR